MIVLNNISFSYRRNHTVLDNITLSLEKGTICGLLGSNGVGKSTLLYIMAGLLRPQNGYVACDGFIPVERKVEFLQDIFIVPEEFELPDITLREYLDVNTGFYPKFSMKDMENYLATFELPTDLHLGRLSMGQKKKVFLSFAMACNTSVLLLDEPTNGLDISSKRSFRRAMASCMTDDKIIVISTHQVFDVEKILDHVVIADNNGILLNSSMMEISSRLRFQFTTDESRMKQAILSLEAPGGANIIEAVDNPDDETEVNLELLFELAHRNPAFINRTFPNETTNR